MTIRDELVAIERSLWSNDAAVYEQTYLADALLVFPVIGRLTLDAALQAIRDENAAGRFWSSVELQSVEAAEIAADVVLLSYTAVAIWNDLPDRPERVLCSTLYIRQGENWRVAFHQQTQY